MLLNEIETIKKKSTVGIIFLSLRNFLIQSISAIGYFLLTFFMGVAEAGLFDIVNEIVSIFGYFSDLGFVAALIQKKDKPKKKEMQTAFTFQQIIVFLSLLLIFITYPTIKANRGYGSKETWLLIALCFSFLTSSLRTIPSVLLERNLKFNTISIVAIIENALYYLIAVILASRGFGSYSYVIAIFVRSTFSLIAYYSLSPWPIGFSFSVNSVKNLFAFGIPYQLNSLIAMIKDRASNVFVAGIIGRQAYAFLGWGQKIPRYSLSLMDAVMKVTFPAISRLQNNKDFVKKYLEKSIFFIALVSFPLLAGSALISKDLINLIPKYTKWLPALSSLYVFSATFAISSLTSPLVNAFNATGNIKLTTKLMIMWTVLTWAFLPTLSYFYGLNGALVANLIINLSSFIVWYLAKTKFDLSVLTHIKKTVLATFLMIFSVIIFNNLLTFNLLPLKIILNITLAVATYILCHYLISKKEISWYIDQIVKLKNV